MIVYRSNGQHIEHQSVIRIRTSYGYTDYIVEYNMNICQFILFPLNGITIPTRQLSDLNLVTTEWEYLGKIYEKECYSQLNVPEGLNQYLTKVEKFLSLNI